jgi:hypothetical protein
MGTDLSWIECVVKVPRSPPAEVRAAVQERFRPFPQLFLFCVGAVADFKCAVEPLEQAGAADAGNEFGFADVVGQDG